MRRVVDLAWLALLAYMVATWQWMPEWVGSSPREALPRNHYMALMLAVAVIVPWLTTRGALLLARRAPALLNLPHKDHWLAPERRDSTLAQLDERLAVLGLGLTLLFAGLHTQALLQGRPDWPQPPGAVWIAGAMALGIGFLAWMLAFLRHFSRLAPVTTPHPRRRRSRNDELVWRESQPLWLMYPILAGAALFILKVHGSVSTSNPSASGSIVVALTICALVLLVLGRLVTEVRGDSLRWHYGWLGLPRWRVDLDDIVTVEPARSTWTEGWGIRFTGEGMLYNSSGTHAVRLTLRDGRRLRLGSQDAQRLVQVLQQRLHAA